MVTIRAKSLNEYHVFGIELSIMLILSHLILTTMLQGMYYLCFIHKETKEEVKETAWSHTQIPPHNAD